MNIINNNFGFTLLEIMLSVAMIGVIAGIGVPVYQSLQVRNDLDLAARYYSDALRRAQVLSQAVDGDTTWGVRAEPGLITIFKGSSFALRDVSFDERMQISPNIGISGNTEIVFSKLFGLPNVTGNTSLTSVDGSSKNININAKGGLSY